MSLNKQHPLSTEAAPTSSTQAQASRRPADDPSYSKPPLYPQSPQVEIALASFLALDVQQHDDTPTHTPRGILPKESQPFTSTKQQTATAQIAAAVRSVVQRAKRSTTTALEVAGLGQPPILEMKNLPTVRGATDETVCLDHADTVRPSEGSDKREPVNRRPNWIPDRALLHQWLKAQAISPSQPGTLPNPNEPVPTPAPQQPDLEGAGGMRIPGPMVFHEGTRVPSPPLSSKSGAGSPHRFVPYPEPMSITPTTAPLSSRIVQGSLTQSSTDLQSANARPTPKPSTLSQDSVEILVDSLLEVISTLVEDCGRIATTCDSGSDYLALSAQGELIPSTPRSRQVKFQESEVLASSTQSRDKSESLRKLATATPPAPANDSNPPTALASSIDPARMISAQPAVVGVSELRTMRSLRALRHVSIGGAGGAAGSPLQNVPPPGGGSHFKRRSVAFVLESLPSGGAGVDSRPGPKPQPPGSTTLTEASLQTLAEYPPDVATGIPARVVGEPEGGDAGIGQDLGVARKDPWAGQIPPSTPTLILGGTRYPLPKNQSSFLSQPDMLSPALTIAEMQGTVVVNEYGNPVLCQFEILAELGRGNFGKVSLVIDSNGDLFALKSLYRGKKMRKMANTPSEGDTPSLLGMESVGPSHPSMDSAGDLRTSTSLTSTTGSKGSGGGPLSSPHSSNTPGDLKLTSTSSMDTGNSSERATPNPFFARKVAVERKERDLAQREIAVMKKLSHPNVVKLYAVIEDPDEQQTHLVMQFVDNGSIGSVARDQTCRALPFTLALKYMAQVARGLEYLHSQNIIHRDVKPENILIGSDDTAYLSDFGVSSIVSDDSTPRGVAGTLAFFAPELLASVDGAEQYGKEADTWAFGVTLYALLFGRLPFVGRTGPGLMRSILMDELVIPECFPEVKVIPPTKPAGLSDSQDAFPLNRDICPFLHRHIAEIEKLNGTAQQMGVAGHTEKGQLSEHSSLAVATAANLIPVPAILRDLLKGLLLRDPQERLSLRAFRHSSIVRHPDRYLRRLTRSHVEDPIPRSRLASVVTDSAEPVQRPTGRRQSKRAPNPKEDETTVIQVAPISSLVELSGVNTSDDEGVEGDPSTEPRVDDEPNRPIPPLAEIVPGDLMANTSSDPSDNSRSGDSIALPTSPVVGHVTQEDVDYAITQCNLVFKWSR